MFAIFSPIMSAVNYKGIQEIFFSCTEKQYAVSENIVPVNGVGHIYSGEITAIEGDEKYTYRAGETILFRRNKLAKFIKVPGPEGPFRSVSIFFTQPFLQEYYATHPFELTHPMDSHAAPVKAIRFDSNPLFLSLFNSLLPYEEVSGPLPQELINIKLVEAMTILRSVDRGIDNLLADFAEPGKIDLENFMQRNFSFNVPIERFSYLTGRSVSTFKRDFQRVFNASPQRWLLQKRLKQAHYLIAEKKQKPSEVYLEVGFENLSHFSASFKQLFGYNASSL